DAGGLRREGGGSRFGRRIHAAGRRRCGGGASRRGAGGNERRGEQQLRNLHVHPSSVAASSCCPSGTMLITTRLASARYFCATLWMSRGISARKAARCSATWSGSPV